MKREEVEELNSECYICRKTKFLVVPDDTRTAYSLERCVDPSCTDHCSFNHETVFVYEDASEDTVYISSGWGSH